MASVHEKLLRVQFNLLSVEIPKSGYNPFGKFNHYTLEDLQVPILQECYKENLLCEFTFTEQQAILKIRDVTEDGLIISNAIPMPELEKLAKMNIAQSLGSYLTYLKKYLLVNTFLISESGEDLDTLKDGGIEDVTPQKDDFSTADKDKPLSDYATPTTCISAIKNWIKSKGNRVTNERVKKRAWYLYKNKSKIDGEMYHEIKKICEGDDAI